MPDIFLSETTGLTNSKLSIATATPSDVLEGKTFYSGDKILQTGILPDYKNKIRGMVLSATGDNTGAIAVIISGSSFSYNRVKRSSISNEYFTTTATHGSGISVTPKYDVKVLADVRWNYGAIWSGSVAEGYAYGTILNANTQYRVSSFVSGINGGCGGAILFELV